MTSRALCIVEVLVSKKTTWRLIAVAGSLAVFQGVFCNCKRNVNLSFYGFPKEEKLRSRWLHQISRKNFSPSTGHRACNLHFEGGKKNLHEQCSCYFSFGKVPFKTIPQTKEKNGGDNSNKRCLSNTRS